MRTISEVEVLYAHPKARTANLALRLTDPEIIKDYFINRTEVDSILDVRVENTGQLELVVRAKPEAFGMVKLHTKSIIIYPKCLPSETTTRHQFDLLTSLFFFSNKTIAPMDRSSVENALERSNEFRENFFDFYFFLIFSEMYRLLRRYDRQIIKSEIIETPGVKGRIKFVESIRVFKGLKHSHVCEVQNLEPRLFFLGFIKGVVAPLIKFCLAEPTVAIGKKLMLLLEYVEPIEVNRENLRKLIAMKPMLIAESKKIHYVVEQIIQLAQLFVKSLGHVGHSGFSMDMDDQYESIVFEYLKLALEGSEIKLVSGNNEKVWLLHSSSELVEVEKVDSETQSEIMTPDAGAIWIKPDIMIKAPEGQDLLIFDSKYRILGRKGHNKEFITGVSADELQQVLTYWMQSTSSSGYPPRIGLIYPAIEPEMGTNTAFKQLASLNLSLGGKDNKWISPQLVVVEVWAFDLFFALSRMQKKSVDLSGEIENLRITF